MKQKRLLARLLALLFALVFAAGFVLPTFAQGDLFADFTHQIVVVNKACGAHLCLHPRMWFEIYTI